MAALNNVSPALAAAIDQLPEPEQALETVRRPIRETNHASNWVALELDMLSNHLEAETAIWEATTLCCKGPQRASIKTAHFRLEWLRTDGSETDYDSLVSDAVNKLQAHCESYLRRFSSN
ncbi:hypothetical protein SPRG_12191 [Saprolegnia parasitica CBS 223.65]|uniref:Uncharacterized protein n=1 Tax=Saprolegnia parasitica (strain CBS 223.65) TaxID=695850 RepID=A0A067BW83_SAPPC|nr:hypothetical protein SPRG_12191 [Saprolegnia parasitica CBS 223.65]KDO22764.1 hypothetical protein SPRG_12191 [Saprolegnia parasitica CBS 223.65]|eukprot:XP_012206548.1 hypothetical protein SPRG_12191 [Saprolegnia parasitica CBS 223.65]